MCTKSDRLKETFILAPGARSSELLRTLAKAGVNTIGLRIVSGLELARTALMKSGISVTEEFLPSGNEAAVIYSFLSSIPYFASASYADAESLSGALRTLRGLIAQDEREELKKKLSCGEFPDKNAALFDVYERYISACSKDKRIDGIGIIRRAVSEAAPFNAVFYTLKEFPISFLEEALVSHVSNGEYKQISILDLFKAKPEADQKYAYMKGYGTVNEAEAILADILKGGIPFDKAMIVCANTANYVQTLYDLTKRYNISVTFGSGVPITNSMPAALAKLIFEWDSSGYNGIDALHRILASASFDRKKLSQILGLEETIKHSDIEALAKTAGSLRISFNAADNQGRISRLKAAVEAEAAEARTEKAQETISKTLELIRRTQLLAVEFEKGITSFIETFAVIRPEPYGRIDRSALNVLLQSLGEFYNYAPDGKLSDILPRLLAKTVSSEPSREGALHICSVKDAMSCMRAHIYVCGLSASDFPGSPSENYLLLDTDLAAFGDDPRIPTSLNIVGGKRNSLDDMLSLALSLGSDVQLSYSDYELSDLKDKNPSSVLFSYYEKEHPGADLSDFIKTVRSAGYFDSELSDSRLAAGAYSKGKEIDFEASAETLPDASQALELAWSPSALEIFFQCPRRFYLTKIIKLPENEPDDPFEIISAADTGTLAHGLMELLANSGFSKTQFLEKAAASFDRFLLSRPPLHESSAELERSRFLKMMGTAFDQEMQCGGEVLSAEEEFNFTHPSGVKLHGYPDRVEKTENGEYIIADFKTKRRIDHVKDDIDTCLQVVIYAWLCEQAGIDITRCEYRYIRKNELVTCVYDEYMKGKLSEKLEQFKEALLNNTFPKSAGKDACRYCRMTDLCRQFDDSGANLK